MATIPHTAEVTRPASGPSDFGKRLLRGGAWVVIGRGIGVLCALLVELILAQRLNGQYGVFRFLFTSIAFLGIFSRLGTENALLRFAGESIGLNDHWKTRRTFKRAFLTTLCASIVVAPIGSVLFTWCAAVPGDTSLVIAIAFAVAMTAMLQLSAEALRTFHDLRSATLFEAQSAGVGVMGLFLLLLIAPWTPSQLTLTRVFTLFALAEACLLVPALATVLKRLRDFRGGEPPRAAQSADQNELRTFMAASIPLAALQLIAFVGSRGDIWIARAVLGDHDLSLYGAASRLVQVIGLPLVMVNLSVISSIAPLYVADRNTELQKVLRTSATLATVVALPVLLVLIAMPQQVMGLVFGSEFSSASMSLIGLSLGVIVFTWTGPCGFLLTLTGHQREQLAVTIASSIMLFVTAWLAGSWFGPVGIALSVSACMAIHNLTCWALARRLTGVWTHAGCLFLLNRVPHART